MSVYIPVTLQHQIRSIFADCCAYCQTAEALTVAIFEFEHILPRSAGGDTKFDNLCLACPTCNRYKASRQSAMDPVTESSVSLFNPQVQDWYEHFTWSDNATRIVGLTPAGRATILALKMNRSQLIRVRTMWVAMDEHPPKIK